MAERAQPEHTERVFICMPLKPMAQGHEEAKKEFLENIERAKIVARWAVLHGYNPIATTAYYTQFLDDFSKDERLLDQKLRRELLETCQWIWIIPRPDQQTISEEMRADIEHADKYGLKKYWWWHDAVERMKDWLYYYDIIMNWDAKK